MSDMADQVYLGIDYTLTEKSFSGYFFKLLMVLDIATINYQTIYAVSISCVICSF